MTLTRDSLLAFLDSELGISPDAIEDDDTPLFSSGLVDSLGVMEVVGLIEREGSIDVAPTEIVLDNLDSVRRILDYVERKRS